MPHLHSEGKGDPSCGWCRARRWEWNARWADIPGDTRRKWTGPHWSRPPPLLRSGTAQDRGTPGAHRLEQTTETRGTGKKKKTHQERNKTAEGESFLWIPASQASCKWCQMEIFANITLDLYANAHVNMEIHHVGFSTCCLMARKTFVCLLACRWGGISAMQVCTEGFVCTLSRNWSTVYIISSNGEFTDSFCDSEISSNMEMPGCTRCHHNDTTKTLVILEENIFFLRLPSLLSDLAHFTSIPAGFLPWYSNLKPGLFWEWSLWKYIVVSWEVVRRDDGTSWPLNRPIIALVSRGPLRISRKSWLASVEKLRNCMWAPENRRTALSSFNNEHKCCCAAFQVPSVT